MKNVQHWTRAMEKQVEFRVNALFRDEQMLSVYREFGGDIFRRSSVFHGLDDFLRENKVQGDTAFEIGTWAGLTSAILARYFRKVVTIDIVDHPLKHKVLSHLGITNVECIQIKDNADKPQVVYQLGAGFDFAYLDGDHHSDTEGDFETVKRCGRVMFQEAWPIQPPVWELVNALPQEQVTYGGFGFALWDTRPKG